MPPSDLFSPERGLHVPASGSYWLARSCCTCVALWIALHLTCSLLFPPMLFSTTAIALLSPLVFFPGSWFCSLFLFVFYSYFRAVKAIFTLGFVLTFISVFSVVVVHLWVCHYSCFFAWLQFGFLDLSSFGALLTPICCAIRGVPYQITFSVRPLFLVFVPRIYRAASFICCIFLFFFYLH
jgi:hypothetical protein